MKARLRQLFCDALSDLQVEPHLRAAIADLHPPLGARQPLLLIAFGKAARPMAQALLDLLPGTRVRGLLVPPEPDTAPLAPLEVIAASHPLPGPGSLQAAARALELCRSVRADEHVIFLVSGGGSALLELPADPALPLGELQDLYRNLIASGADITVINTARRHLSAVKGGRLALAAAAASSQLTLAISDVPDGNPAALASGPTVAEPVSLAACRELLQQYGLAPRLPRSLRDLLASDLLPAPLAPDDPLATAGTFRIVLDNHTARRRLQHHAEAAGLLVVADQSVDDRPYEEAAAHLLTRLDALHHEHPHRTVAVLTGGELSVPLPASPGCGGRNQQFALACALRVQNLPITVLSCGTDGIDGNSTAAGAIADGTTLARATAAGYDAADCLRRCDAHPLFAALGDTVTTGPTGTNVRDLRLLVRRV